MGSNIIKIGDKVDIRILQHVEQAKRTGERPVVYHSKVLDILAGGRLEVSVPQENGRNVLLPKGIRLEFIFYSSGDIYRCIAHIKDRYAKDQIPMFLVEPKTALEKYQRRDYYRFECAMDMQYMPITEVEAEMEDIAEIKEHHRLHYPQDLPRDGVAVDLSGGGVRFVGGWLGDNWRYVLMSMHLKNEAMDYHLEIVGDILLRQKAKADQPKYEYRVNFLPKSRTEREMIIKYIFEQERRSREKG